MIIQQGKDNSTKIQIPRFIHIRLVRCTVNTIVSITCSETIIVVAKPNIVEIMIKT